MKSLVLFLSFFSFLCGGAAFAQNAEGSFNLSPSSAPDLVLEGGPGDGTPVSIAKPTGGDSQKWTFLAKGNNLYVIQAAASPTRVLSGQPGAVINGTAVILATENDQPAQLWALKKNENGSFSLIPQYALPRALDDPGGSQAPGTKPDLWERDPDDAHTQWVLKPLENAKLPVLASLPEGVVKEFTFKDSTIFPGTTRTGSVFIPAQYDGSKPACVYVQQDGYRSQNREMLAQLIANHDMPVVVGVFIHPGDVPVPAGAVTGTSGRRNRCYEYDGVSDRYARFVSEELLPFVAKKFNLNLSTSGNDRCLVGASSGGIAAFNAAWLHPEDFSRVYSCSGSFSAFRGGYEIPTLVRKFEAQPIRAYLTAGTQDMENCAGDWYLLNQQLDAALKFSGYDYSFHVVNGGHGAGYDQNFPDAMRFIWKGWPAPVPEGSSAPRVRDIITEDGPWSLALKNYQDARSPAANSKGEVYFVDAPANKIYRVDQEGAAQVFLSDAKHANGLAVGPKDELYTVSATTGRIMAYDSSGKGHLYAEHVPGRYVLARPDGGLYVTADSDHESASRIWFVKDGKKTEVDSGLKAATGLAMRPDQWLLCVADGQSKWVYSYAMGSDGRLTDKEPFFDLQVPEWDDDAGPESVCYSQENRILVATRSGVQICADDGPSQVILPVPDHARVTGVVLGGTGMNMLYAFCGDKVWKRVVKIHGTGAFSPAIPVKPTSL